MPKEADLKVQLEALLEKAGPERIRRPVFDTEDNLLAQGIADDRDGDPDDMDRIVFADRTVIDLGCNFGSYSFLARQKGASHVLGVDLDPLVIEGSRLLGRMQSLNSISFVCRDFTDPAFTDQAQVVLLIDFFGKGLLLQGIDPFLDATERMATETMIISARSHYRLEKHFRGQAHILKTHYPEVYIHGGRIYPLAYIRDYFKDNWDMTILSPETHDSGSKKTLCFNRK